MSADVAVLGATGVAGRAVADGLEQAGRTVRRLSRGTGVDVATGRGLREALEGAGTVVDLTNLMTVRGRRSAAFFGAAATHLVDAARTAGLGHVVALSVVGADRVDAGYYRGKLLQERTLLTSGVPTTLLRTTQFHDLARQLLATARRGPFVVVPTALVAPVDVREVAAEVVDLALGHPVPSPPDLAGPETFLLGDLVRRVARREAPGTRVVDVRLPGRAGRALARGALLPHERTRTGTSRFDDWLRAGGPDRPTVEVSGPLAARPSR